MLRVDIILKNVSLSVYVALPDPTHGQDSNRHFFLAISCLLLTYLQVDGIWVTVVRRHVMTNTPSTLAVVTKFTPV